MGGFVRAKLSNLRSRRIWEQHLRPQERLQDLELERHTMEYLYSAEGACTFMRPDTFEQIAVPVATVGLAEKFLQPGMELPVDFFEAEPIGAVLPEVAEARVASTAAPTHSQQDAAWKEATLENGFRFAFRCSLLPERLCEWISKPDTTLREFGPSAREVRDIPART